MNMSEDKFTKGDWRIRACEVGVIDNSDTQSYGMMKVICTLDQYDFKEWNRNAHLIAAAPDMYKTIESLIYVLNHAIDEINTMRDIHHKDNLTPADHWDKESLHDAEVLLAKARGE